MKDSSDDFLLPADNIMVYAGTVNKMELVSLYPQQIEADVWSDLYGPHFEPHYDLKPPMLGR